MIERMTAHIARGTGFAANRIDAATAVAVTSAVPAMHALASRVVRAD
jgi:hypothetical protein